MRKREICISENSGFCFGVKRALDKTLEQLDKMETQGTSYHDRNRIYTLGPLIHNQTVIDELNSKGIAIINSPEEAIEGDTVIVRSHGQGEDFYAEAKELGINIVDATCPFVERIHELVRAAYDKGRSIIIVGTAEHPEVVGINGWCNREGIIVNSRHELEKSDVFDKLKGRKCFVVCQTTLKVETYMGVLDLLTENCIDYETENTICNATTLRQESCKELAKKMEAMVILGGMNSSNSRKLFEIASEYCENSYFAENIHDLPLQELAKYYKIGIAAGASTPGTVIKEVIANMTDKQLENNVQNPMEDFMDEIESSLKLPKNGDIVEGQVHMVTDDEVIVNLGFKKDGILKKEEASLSEGETLKDKFKEDDEIQAIVKQTGDDDGGILLSQKGLAIIEHWNELAEAYEKKDIITVKVTKAIASGAIAEYKDITGFIPMSQLSNKYIENAEEFVGQELEARVIRCDLKKQRAIFSRKSVLREERKKQIEAIWENIHEGDIIEGKVMRFTDFGAFVDIGGLDGLLHISEISWGKLKHPKEVLTLGETINVKVLAMNEETGRISLGLKQTTPEPWSVIDDKIREGDIVKGKVVQIKDYGAFVEIEAGLDGLVHISEISRQRIAHTSDVLKVGQIVYAKVIAIDTEKRRISLSLKDTMDYSELQSAQQDSNAESADENENVADADADTSEGDYYFKTDSAPDQDSELAKDKETMLEAAGAKNEGDELAESTIETDRVAGAREAVEGHYDSSAEKVGEPEQKQEDQDYYLEDSEGKPLDHELAKDADKSAKEAGESDRAADEIAEATADRDEKADKDKLACDAYLQNAECE
ncbi:bifunctional 4-hydroxy-3-methylbut-2-enyl diphosphate reductase/30S ribosomal protein S1 [Anaerovoracaceae bacterium SGI.195]